MEVLLGIGWFAISAVAVGIFGAYLIDNLME